MSEEVKKHGRLRPLCIALCVLILLAVWCGYQVWRSYYMLETRTMDVQLERWESAAEYGDGAGVRIAVIADLHETMFGENNEPLVQQILAVEPDLIVMAGDMLGGAMEECEALLSLVRQLAAQCPVYYGLGNHELEYMESHPELPRMLAEAGAVVLEEDYVDIAVQGRAVRIGGMFAYGFFLEQEDLLQKMSQERQDTYHFLQEFQETDACKVLICHRPDSFIFHNAGELWDVDLVISGHLHGGQVVLPMLGGLWAPDQGWFPDYVDGLHRCGQVQVAITTGLGSQVEALPRFNNPPEILVLQVHADPHQSE